MSEAAFPSNPKHVPIVGPMPSRGQDLARVSHEQTFPLVDRRSGLSLREFRHEYLFPQRPVVITDTLNGWAALAKWTFPFFAGRYGRDQVRVYRYDREEEFQDKAAEHVTFGSYIEAVTSQDWSSYPYYLRDNWRLLHDHPELATDYRVPKYFFDWYRGLPRFLRMPYPRLFLGPKGAVTPLHTDIWGTHAWLSQLVGRKRWMLFSPDQSRLHYDAKVRVDAPDLDRYPRYREVRPVEATIGPGDTIFVPSRWAHWVVSLDPTISLTGNYMAYGCFGIALSSTMKEFLGKRVGGRLYRRR